MRLMRNNRNRKRRIAIDYYNRKCIDSANSMFKQSNFEADSKWSLGIFVVLIRNELFLDVMLIQNQIHSQCPAAIREAATLEALIAAKFNAYARFRYPNADTGSTQLAVVTMTTTLAEDITVTGVIGYRITCHSLYPWCFLCCTTAFDSFPHNLHRK